MTERRPDLDLYEILGVVPTASAADITRAYRRRVRDLHPDSRPEGAAADPGGLVEVLAAYQVLHDPDHRAEYDATHRPPAPHSGIAIPVRRIRTDESTAGDAWLYPGPVRGPAAAPDPPPRPAEPSPLDLLRLVEALYGRRWWW